MFVWILVGFLGLIAVLWLLFLAASASVEIMKDIVESARSVMVYCRSLFRRISIDKTKSLRERNQHRIQVALSGQLSSELDVPKVVNQTLENIMHAEGRLDLLKTHAEWPREWGRPNGVRPLRVAAEAGGAARVPHEVPGTALTLGLNRTGAAGFTPQGQWHAAPPSPRIRRSPLPRPQPR